ncbi:MAG: hypothetical protein ACRELG_26500 [Gemmataceae bacterium]
MLDNVTLAIFCKLNDLAERHGLKPYDFVVTLKDGPRSEIRLEFEVHPTGNGLKERQYNRMLQSLGIPDDGHILEGTDRHIIDLLDNALQLAPNSRARPRS